MELFELIAYGFLFLAFLLFNWVTQRAKRRRLERQRVALEKFRQQPGGLEAGEFGRTGPLARPEPVARPADPTRPAPARRPESVTSPADPLGQHGWGREAETLSYETLSYEVPVRYSEEKPAAPPRPRAATVPAPKPAAMRHPRGRILRTPRDLRNAVVAMTVLGPCRALQPYEPPGTDAAPVRP